MKKKLRIIFINVFVFLVILLLCEILVRGFYPEINFPGTDSSLVKNNVFFSSPGLNPLSSGKSNSVVKYVTEDGFWKFANEDDDPDSTILLLGDSVTMGIGVDSDSTFAGILNNQLNDLSILNPSLIGYSSTDYLNITKALFMVPEKDLLPSRVFVFWCLNDVYENYGSKEPVGFSSTSFLDRLVGIFRTNSKLFHFLKNLAFDRPKSYYLFDEQFYLPNNEYFVSAMNDLVNIKSVLETSDIDLTVIILPYEYQLRKQSSELIKPQTTLTSFLEKKQFTVYDFAPELSEYNSKDLYLFGDGIHFSEFGHRVIANILQEKFF